MRLKIFIIFILVAISFYYFKNDKQISTSIDLYRDSNSKLSLQPPRDLASRSLSIHQADNASLSKEDVSQDIAIQKLVADIVKKIELDEVDYAELIKEARTLKMPDGAIISERRQEVDRVIDMKTADSGKVTKHWQNNALKNESYTHSKDDVWFSREYDDGVKLSSFAIGNQEFRLQLTLDGRGHATSETRLAYKKVFFKNWDKNGELTDFYSDEIDNGNIKKVDYLKQKVSHYTSEGEDGDAADSTDEE